MIKFKTKIGNSTIELEATDLKAVFRFSSLVSRFPSKCDACGCEEVFLDHKSPKGNDYYMVTCKKCTASVSIGQLKAGGFFWKNGSKMEVYRPDGQQASKKSEEFQDDIPF